MRMRLTALAAILVLGAGCSQAEEDLFANYYDNTIVVTNADGETSIYIARDGTFSETLPDGTPIAGTWKIEGAESCFYVPEVPTHCVPAVSHQAGDTWDVPAVDGTIEKAELKAGR